MNNKPCPICGENLVEESWGTNPKTKKPWHAYRHEDKEAAKTNCKDVATGKEYIDWINEPKTPKIAQNKGNIAPSLEEASVLSAIRELRLLIQALAVLSGYTLRDLQDEFMKLKETK